MASLVSGILSLFHLPSKQPNFPFEPWAIVEAIVHGGQKLESAQKIHCCTDAYIQHINHSHKIQLYTVSIACKPI